MTEKYMSFWDHCAELKSRIKISAYTLIIGFFVFYWVTSYLLAELMDHFLGSYSNVQLIATDPMVGFITRIQFALILAVAITIPFFIYEMFLFINPALNKTHSRLFIRVSLSSMFLFVAGVAFVTFVLIPLMLKFFISYNAMMGLTNFFAIDSFFKFVVITMFVGGVIFQVPLVILLANQLGLVKKSTLSHSRKWVYLIILILSGIATPDHSIISQLALSIVIIMLFEGSLLFCKKDPVETSA
ncbi:twin-arginine translocase subunit TatC [Candidatus Woesearchaeota archaeon]|nr:twin-arginine translocase subunit TatC [Candidatus Woesearchaeota archaeon]